MQFQRCLVPVNLVRRRGRGRESKKARERDREEDERKRDRGDEREGEKEWRQVGSRTVDEVETMDPFPVGSKVSTK